MELIWKTRDSKEKSLTGYLPWQRRHEGDVAEIVDATDTWRLVSQSAGCSRVRIAGSPPQDAAWQAMQVAQQSLREVRLLLSEVKRLQHLSPENEKLEPSPWESWRRAHWQELMSHAGERVAIHPKLGIVAHDKDVAVVIARVRELGLAKDVLIESVRKRVSPSKA